MNRTSDFLIVGAGSAGCVVARVLAEAGFQVRVLEAGPPQPPRRRPAEYLYTFDTAEDWGYRTLPQPELANRRLHWPRGRGPGGSTRINAMIWYPPRDCDLQMLHAHGGEDWSISQLAASLQQVTDWVQPQPPRWLSEASERFLRCCQYPAVDPPAAFARMNGRGGRRTAADLLSESTAPAGSIEIVSAQIDRLVFRANQAIGVQTVATGHAASESWYTERGVILCGGSIASPLVLMRSGIGPSGKLRSAGIAVRYDAPDVGKHLADHLIMPVVFTLPDSKRFPAPFTTGDLARWQINRTGPIASNLAEAGAIYALPVAGSGGEVGETEFQVHLTPTHYLLHPHPRAPAAMTIGVNLCRPRSRGQICITTADPAVPPAIDPAYLSAAQDAERLAAAVDAARHIAADAALQPLIGEERVPGAGRRSPSATLKAIQRYAQTLYHPVGTCRMGSDAQSVVDPNCRVRGCDGLYVIDASVLPQIPSINPNATVMMLAHHVASQLKV